MGRKRKVSDIKFGWVVERNIGREKKILVYCNEKRPWYQGELHEATVWTHQREAQVKAYWNCARVREVKIVDGIISLLPEFHYEPVHRWTGEIDESDFHS